MAKSIIITKMPDNEEPVKNLGAKINIENLNKINLGMSYIDASE